MCRQLNFFMFFILCLIGFNSCVSSKVLLKKPIERSLPSDENTSYKLTITPNASLLVRTDNFNSNDIILQQGQNLILKFEYQTESPKNVADANYREVLYIEMPNQAQEIDLARLNKTSIWFARFCFCKDYVGFFKVTPEKFELLLSKNQLHIKSEFEWHKLPRIVNKINQNINLKP